MSETYSLAEATMKAIQDRRSIREWTTEPISDQDLAMILEAGRLAPSGADHFAPMSGTPSVASGHPDGKRLLLCPVLRNASSPVCPTIGGLNSCESPPSPQSGSCSTRASAWKSTTKHPKLVPQRGWIRSRLKILRRLESYVD